MTGLFVVRIAGVFALLAVAAQFAIRHYVC
jgi:hypothetical protein